MSGLIFNVKHGLVTSTFDGVVRVFDTIEFKKTWEYKTQSFSWMEKGSICILELSK